MTDGTVDSGIEFDISSLLSVSDVMEVEAEKAAATVVQTEPAPQYHELKSRVVEGSPRIDFRTANVETRTQMRLNLERQQFIKLAEEEKQRQAQQRQQQQQSQTISVPSVYHSAEVPPKVLQVKTELSHPTIFHMKQKQEHAVKSYIRDSGDHQIPAHSLPNLGLPSAQDSQWMSGSAPVEMDNGAYTSDLDMNADFELLNGFILDSTVDLNQDTDLHLITPSLTQISSTLPPQAPYPQGLGVEAAETAGAKSSSSCPPVFSSHVSPPTHMSEEEQKLWSRDRQKKDNHNMIERRRRYHINDRIKELGTLLPKNYDQDMRVNKGSILKLSVDYIKQMQQQNQELPSLKIQTSTLTKQVKLLHLLVNQMLAAARSGGFGYDGVDEAAVIEMLKAPERMLRAVSMLNVHMTTTPPPVTTTTLASPSQPQQLLNLDDPSSSTLTQPPSTSTATAGVYGGFLPLPGFTSPAHNAVDFMEDTGSPVNSDPMLTSAPVSPDHDDSPL